MTEEELVMIVNKQRNVKAAGVDDIKAEIMKHLVRNKKIKEALLKSCNKCLDEEVNENWLLSKTIMLPKTKKSLHIEHRPIAVTVWSSKVMYGFFRQKI